MIPYKSKTEQYTIQRLSKRLGFTEQDSYELYWIVMNALYKYLSTPRYGKQRLMFGEFLKFRFSRNAIRSSLKSKTYYAELFPDKTDQEYLNYLKYHNETEYVEIRKSKLKQ